MTQNQSKTVKRPKTQRSAPTQDELLKRAQEMEERNVIEHRDYLKTEDEKRQRARLVRPTIEGRLVRWVSKVEEEIIPIAPPESMMSGAITSHGYTTPLRSSTPYMTPFYTTDPGPPLHWSNSTAAPGPSSPSAYTSAYPHPPTLQYSPSPSRPHISSTSSATRPLEPLPTIVQRKQKIAKNYVVLENAQTEKAPRVTWKQTMEGMFGDHVRWEDMRVYSTKNRPLCELVFRLLVSSSSLPVRLQRARERGVRLQDWLPTTWIHKLASHTRTSSLIRRSKRFSSTSTFGTGNLDVTLGKKR